MMNFKEEKKLKKRNYQRIAGIDEAGRGPLAGPVVAAAVIINLELKTKDFKIFKEIKDSKKLRPKRREKFYEIFISHSNIEWGIGIISQKIIDKINILEATKMAMLEAIKKLKKEPDFLLIDGNFLLEKLTISQKAVVSGDEKIISCAIASIIAKVSRDRIMRALDKKYPHYNFRRHKGYGTKEHFQNLNKYGPCSIHRRSFRPIKNMNLANIQ